ncbi:MAG: thioredoxin family protein [Candidatus Wallbacteria bacterium]|nr:thioredoxin family protein [Candidatus Wallbacteria bacterium]
MNLRSPFMALAMVSLAVSLNGCKLGINPGAAPGAAGGATPSVNALGPQAPGSTASIAAPVAGTQTAKAGSALGGGTTEASPNLTGSQSSEAVMLTATWCHYCQLMKQGAWGQAKSSYPGISFREVDVDQQSAEASRIGWSALPTFVFFKSGKEVSRFQGADEGKLSQGLQSLQSVGPSI